MHDRLFDVAMRFGERFLLDPRQPSWVKAVILCDAADRRCIEDVAEAARALATTLPPSDLQDAATCLAVAAEKSLATV